MFISFDGVDGAGKSTQVRLLREWLVARGKQVVTCRDPGSTSLGEKLREVLLSHHDVAIHRRSEMLLYMAARAQLVEEVIRPALGRGEWVLSDRYLLANVVYQAHAGGMNIEEVWQTGRVATGGLMPNLTIVLDMPAAAARARQGRPPDRMEAQGLDYLEKVRQGFLTEATAGRVPIVVFAADRQPGVIHAEVVATVEQLLAGLAGGS
ncbi:Thymidylate kinase [Anatilimnocola aggregata]|uniref:Thymidylate kinase n=1 Tax=Anatilimnocola aggregata TaxID=2528021 RepID=A0A517YCP6_9BACT|nr:dTMP kinase [Anatilimnocola aggregata]QDU28016.1 Thymidylate kinase [Anatilimnocola aggregata]